MLRFTRKLLESIEIELPAVPFAQFVVECVNFWALLQQFDESLKSCEVQVVLLFDIRNLKRR